MAFDLLTKKQSRRDWSCGASDLPSNIPGLVPETFWGPAQMESKLASIMSKPRSMFGSKPTREEALPMLAQYMREKKIGPKDVASGIGAEVGSILLPAKEQGRIFDKIDDLRYDIRSTRDVVGAGMFALAGAVAVLGFGKIYKTARG
jgi:hypothetical protein